MAILAPVMLVFQGELPKDRLQGCEALWRASKGLHRMSFEGPSLGALRTSIALCFEYFNGPPRITKCSSARASMNTPRSCQPFLTHIYHFLFHTVPSSIITTDSCNSLLISYLLGTIGFTIF